MTVTFQLQIDPLGEKQFTDDELYTMLTDFGEFKHKLEKFNEYIRFEMFVDKILYYKVC